MRYDTQIQMSPNELKSWMTEVGLNEHGLADLLGVTKGCVHHWLTGSRKIPETTAKLITYFKRYPMAMLDF